jgi:MtrB/PioB family decaheme-associated outer membrane protein
MRKNHDFRQLPLAAAMLAAFGCATAQNNAEVQALITPSSSVSAGLGIVNDHQDAKRFGQYNGLNENGAYGLIDLDLIKRNDDTGTWLILKGRDLGLDTRELSITHQRQGDWKYAIEYNEMVRRDPYTIHTGMTGVGTASPTINLINKPAMPAAWAAANGLQADNGVAGSDLELKIKRTALGISAEKWLGQELQLEGNFRTEQRRGARLFGRAGLNSSDMSQNILIGTGNANGRWAILLTPEPIDSRTNIFEARANFNRDKLAISAGYYGSFFTNEFGSLTPSVPGTLNRGVLWNGASGSALTIAQNASSPVALAPDNQAHQLYVSGTYGFSSATRINFKASYTHATQNEDFSAMGLTPATGAPSSLGGVVNTLLAQGGLSYRATKDLTINANLRYEDRNDKTPVGIYNTSGVAGPLNNSTNWPSASQTRTSAKLDGIYRLPQGYSLVAGGDWERKKTPLPIANTGLYNNQVLFRETLNEYGLRGELRKALSDTLNAAIGAEFKKRRGGDGDWQTASGGPGNQLVGSDPATANRVLPDMYMDRDRTKVRASTDWAPAKQLDLQVILEHAVDQYKRLAPTSAAGVAIPVVAGAREMYIDSLTLDSTYALSDNWRLSAYWTESRYRWNVNKVSIGEDTRDSSRTVGLGVKGKVTSRIDLGADLMATHDRLSFTNQIVTGGVLGDIAGWTGQTQQGNFLPTIHYRTDRLKLFANYAADKDSDIRLDVIYQHFKTDDWQWGYNGVPFVYSDNTTVSQPMKQNLFFVSTRYIYKFQ